jgi:hypothetical protein
MPEAGILITALAAEVLLASLTLTALLSVILSIEARSWAIAWALMGVSVVEAIWWVQHSDLLAAKWQQAYWRAIEQCQLRPNLQSQFQQFELQYFACDGGLKLDRQFRLSFDVFHLRYGLWSMNGEQPPFPLFHSHPLAGGGCVYAQAFALIHPGLDDDQSCREILAGAHSKLHTQTAAAPI